MQELFFSDNATFLKKSPYGGQAGPSLTLFRKILKTELLQKGSNATGPFLYCWVFFSSFILEVLAYYILLI